MDLSNLRPAEGSTHKNFRKSEGTFRKNETGF